MKKAFDSNVAKFRPRLRGRVESTTVEPSEGVHEHATPERGEVVGGEGHAEVVATAASVEPLREDAGASAADPTPAATPRMAPTTVRDAAIPSVAPARPEATPREREAVEAAVRTAASLEQSATTDPLERSSIGERRDRLERVKRRVREAAAPTPVVPPMTTPGAAGQSALALLKEVESKLSRANETEEALRHDLADARTEQARSAADSKRTHERLGAVERALDEKRAVLSDMLAEMGALEEERDEAVRRAQALSVLDEERAQVLADVSAQLDDARTELQAAELEMERLSDDLDARAGEAARLRAALAEVTRERDGLAREATAIRRERDELIEARRALEQVHEALAQVRARIV